MGQILKMRSLLLTSCTQLLPGIFVILCATAFADDGRFSWTSGSSTTTATSSGSSFSSELPTVGSPAQPLYRPTEYRPSGPGFSNEEAIPAEASIASNVDSRLIQASYQVETTDSDLPPVRSQAEAPAKLSADPIIPSKAAPTAAPVGKPFFELTPQVDGEQLGASGVAEAGESGSEVLIRGMAWLIVTLCLLSLTILGLRRWQKSQGLLPTTNGRSRVLETLSLGPGRTVSLIEMNGLRALVGSDAGGIRTIVLAPPSFEDEILQANGPDLRVSSMHS